MTAYTVAPVADPRRDRAEFGYGRSGHGCGDVDVDRMPRLVHDPPGAGQPVPLTETQQALWIGRSDAVEFGNVGCHGYFEWERDALDLARFQTAWRRLVARHDMLRTVIRPDGTQQVLPDPPAYRIRVRDLRPCTDA